jgi:hypothetical protein
MERGTMTSFWEGEATLSDGHKSRDWNHLGRQLENFLLSATKKVWSQPFVKLFDEIFVEYFVFLLQRLEVGPLFRVQKVHEVEKLADVVVQGSLHMTLVWGVKRPRECNALRS